MMPPLALLAGGLATRMRPLTETVPKAMLAVAGEPFIAHQLRLFRREGVGRVVLLLGHLGEQVRDFVGDGGRFGLQVDYAFDGPVLLGTGGALKAALPLLGDRFLVMYGDSYLDIAFAPVVAAYAPPALMTVYRNDGRHDTSNVVLEDGRIRLYSKRERLPEMRHIDYGLGLVSAEALAGRDGAFDLAEVYESLSRAGRLAGHEVATRFYEIGSPDGLAETDAYLKDTAA